MATARTSSPSYPPPSPAPEPRASVTSAPALDGFWPADNDSTLRATDVRARTGLRRADRALAQFGELNENVAKLNTTFAAWNAAFEKHWERAGKIAWAAVLAGVATGVGFFIRWLSTFHH
jgi:hypothetical protein